MVLRKRKSKPIDYLKTCERGRNYLYLVNAKTMPEIYRVMEICDYDVATRYFHSEKNAIAFIENELHTKWIKVGWDNWTWSIYKIQFED